MARKPITKALVIEKLGKHATEAEIRREHTRLVQARLRDERRTRQARKYRRGDYWRVPVQFQ